MVPAAMTLPNRCFLLTTEDQYKAHGDYTAKIDAYEADKLDEEAIQQRREKFLTTAPRRIW